MTSHQHPATGGPIYRIGRAPEPRDWPPATIEGRYSHPEGAVRVLYGASKRRAAFLETLQSFRPALADLAALQKRMDLPPDFPDDTSIGQIPDDYFHRRIAAFRVDAAEPILNLCSPATHALLRRTASIVLVGEPEPILRDDPDLYWAATLFGLRV